MGNPIVVVGCGLVGSVFTTEFLRRAFAGELPQPFLFIDGDRWERRNAANQNVTLLEATEREPKAKTMAILARAFEHEADWEEVRLDAENARYFLKDAQVVVDGVDNLATRQLIWEVGLSLRVPVVHIGISEMGTGSVEWSHLEHDTFHLAPHRLIGKPTPTDPESGVTPPCQLVRTRGVALNAGFAAAMAVAMFLGFDPEANIPEGSRGWLTDWMATPNGFQALRETWSKLGTDETEGSDEQAEGQETAVGALAAQFGG